MLIQTATSDLIRVITSAAVTVDVHASWVDHTLSTDNVLAGRTNTLITTATTTTVVAAPASGDTRNTQFLIVRNRHASTATDVTVTFEQSGAVVHEMIKVTLLAGQSLEFAEGLGFYVVTSQEKLNKYLMVTADVANATTSFADITGLTCPVEAGKHYVFECVIFHIENASTTGARFGINGPAMTAMRIGGASVFAGSITAATWNAATVDVTAVDTSILGVTTSSAATPQVVTALMQGWINPSAAGTFAVRSQSEVAVGAGVTVKAGSWCHISEAPQG